MFMRQRNVKNKKEIINNSKYIVKNQIELKGNWQSVFNNNYPIYIEIGMGKGDFLLENAIKYPNINFIGIEKFDSIMALAIKKIEQYELNNFSHEPLILFASSIIYLELLIISFLFLTFLCLI